MTQFQQSINDMPLHANAQKEDIFRNCLSNQDTAQSDNETDGDFVGRFIYLNTDHRRTSIQDPYKIVDVVHVVNNLMNPCIKGRLTISISPGKKDKRNNRNLQIDLDAVKKNGIQIIVCLLEWSEMMMLNISDYPRKAQEEGFLFYHMPIRDMGIPRQKEINVLVPTVVQHLTAGHNVLVHCRGGLGRAGTICACCLTHFGYDGKNAIDAVRKQRPGAIQTSKQEECVVHYYKELIE
jgi:protein-tyrosine phosphatase